MNRDRPEKEIRLEPDSLERVYESESLRVEKNWNRIGRALVGFLLPSRCVACGDARLERFFDGGVCTTCWEMLPRLDSNRCVLCADAVQPPEDAPADPDLPCGRCLLDPPAFERLTAAAPYRGSARQILLAFKFRGADYLAPRLARILVERLRLAAPVDEVTAVPAVSGARWRQDHAAEILGAAVARELRTPFAPKRLEKIRGTERQSALPASRRAANVRGAFRARAGAARRVLVVDDVATSGSTARECARVLRRAGAESIEIWCFARASRDDVDPADS